MTLRGHAGCHVGEDDGQETARQEDAGWNVTHSLRGSEEQSEGEHPSPRNARAQPQRGDTRALVTANAAVPRGGHLHRLGTLTRPRVGDCNFHGEPTWRTVSTCMSPVRCVCLTPKSRCVVPGGGAGLHFASRINVSPLRCAPETNVMLNVSCN